MPIPIRARLDIDSLIRRTECKSLVWNLEDIFVIYPKKEPFTGTGTIVHLYQYEQRIARAGVSNVG